MPFYGSDQRDYEARRRAGNSRNEKRARRGLKSERVSGILKERAASRTVGTLAPSST